MENTTEHDKERLSTPFKWKFCKQFHSYVVIVLNVHWTMTKIFLYDKINYYVYI